MKLSQLLGESPYQINAESTPLEIVALAPREDVEANIESKRPTTFANAFFTTEGEQKALRAAILESTYEPTESLRAIIARYDEETGITITFIAEETVIHYTLTRQDITDILDVDVQTAEALQAAIQQAMSDSRRTLEAAEAAEAEPFLTAANTIRPPRPRQAVKPPVNDCGLRAGIAVGAVVMLAGAGAIPALTAIQGPITMAALQATANSSLGIVLTIALGMIGIIVMTSCALAMQKPSPAEISLLKMKRDAAREKRLAEKEAKERVVTNN